MRRSSANSARPFPEEPAVSRDTIFKALAAYVRSLVSPPTRFDAWIDGDAQALRPAEVRGFGLFVGKAGCVLCHVGWRFTDDRFHDIGLPSPRWRPRRGAGRHAGAAAHSRRRACASWRTPRPTCTTARWRRCEAVVRHYTGGFVARPSLATHINRKLRLSAQEKADLIAFLRTLSSEPGPARARRAGPD